MCGTPPLGMYHFQLLPENEDCVQLSPDLILQSEDTIRVVPGETLAVKDITTFEQLARYYKAKYLQVHQEILSLEVLMEQNVEKCHRLLEEVSQLQEDKSPGRLVKKRK